MSDKSSIEWTDATWNPTRGCDKVSPGCLHCYAETFAERWRGVAGHAYEQGFDPRTAPSQLGLPLTWRKGRRVFVNSMSDLFHGGFSNEYIAAVFGVMAACPQHTFQVLTKRATRLPKWFAWIEKLRPVFKGERAASVYVEHALGVAGAELRDSVLRGHLAASPLPNVHLGVSVEDRKHGLPRIAYLRQVPAALRFLSIEPLLEDLGEIDLTGIGWVIAGGESGPGARPMHPDWVRSIRDQCAAARIPFFFKQWGQWSATRAVPFGDLGGEMRRGLVQIVKRSGENDGHFRDGDELMRRCASKKGAGRLLDGRTHDEFPEVQSG